MYGYLRPYIPELKIQDYRIYRSYCCGVCSQLRADYGLTARLLLNHDMVLLALLADCLAGREGTTVCKACPRHWFKKQCMMRHTKGIRYVSNIKPYNYQQPIPDDVIKSNSGAEYPQNYGY